MSLSSGTISKDKYPAKTNSFFHWSNQNNYVTTYS